VESSRDNSKKESKEKFWGIRYGVGIFMAADSNPAS
jgi:hypothetical protein